MGVGDGMSDGYRGGGDSDREDRDWTRERRAASRVDEGEDKARDIKGRARDEAMNRVEGTGMNQKSRCKGQKTDARVIKNGG